MPARAMRVRFVRVGTLDEPDRLPPDIHIFTMSKQPWVVLPDGTPAVEEYYQASRDVAEGEPGAAGGAQAGLSDVPIKRLHRSADLQVRITYRIDEDMMRTWRSALAGET